MDEGKEGKERSHTQKSKTEGKSAIQKSVSANALTLLIAGAGSELLFLFY